MADVKLKCYECSKEFKKRRGEYNRQLKEGRDYFFCGLSCTATYANKNRWKENYEACRERVIENLKSRENNDYRSDELSPFRKFLRSIEARVKEKDVNSHDVTLEYLKNLWEDQEGICPYSNIKLVLPVNTNIGFPERTRYYEKASLDRIDSEKGYVRGNIQFVSMPINYAKSDRTENELLEFLESLCFYLAY